MEFMGIEKYLIIMNSKKSSVERTKVIQLSHEFSYTSSPNNFN